MDNSARVFWQVCSFPLLTIPLSFVLSPDRNFIKNYAFLEVHGHKDLHFFVFAWNDAEHQIALASKTLWFHDQKYIILIIGLIIYVDWGQWEENGRSRSNFLLFSHNFFFYFRVWLQLWLLWFCFTFPFICGLLSHMLMWYLCSKFTSCTFSFEHGLWLSVVLPFIRV